MKCPKCGYLGFESVDRCRNCGYDFSLVTSAAPLALPELPLRHDAQSVRPLEDLELGDGGAPGASGETAPSSTSELPLFGGDEDRPLIMKPSPPRPPLAVRRATPEVPRLRSEQPRNQTLDLDLDALAPPVASAGVPLPPPAAGWPTLDNAESSAEDAGLGARLVAVLIDLTILAVVDVAVVYFTMQICGIMLWELRILPKGPLLAFLLVQNGGYLVVFTAGGQTLGKMAAGIRVVSDASGSPLDLGRAVLRTIVWFFLAVPAGLGFHTALSRDRRGLHDRVAGTRVVRASA